MSLLRAVEIARLIEHDERMRRPVRELFPPDGPQVTSVCRLCKTVYKRSAHRGKSRGFCTERCRDEWCRLRKYTGQARPPQSVRRAG